LGDFALRAALLPWAVLVLLALAGLVTFILGGMRRSGAGHGFMLVAMILGWVAVILLNPVVAIIGTEVGSCSS
jgi:hypothetical protein